MKLQPAPSPHRAFSLIEMLCVIVIIALLAGLILGPASRMLHRMRADKWENQSAVQLDAIVEQLRRQFQGKSDFPPVTLERLEREKLLNPYQMAFLKDSRVTFFSFSGTDPDDKVVIRVDLERGYLSQAGFRTECKKRITARPE